MIRWTLSRLMPPMATVPTLGLRDATQLRMRLTPAVPMMDFVLVLLSLSLVSLRMYWQLSWMIHTSE